MVFNGDNLVVFMDNGTGGPEEVALSQDCKLSIDLAMAKATTKDSLGWEEAIAGNLKWSMDVNSLVDFHPSSGYHGVADIATAQISKSKVTLYFQLKTQITGDVTWSGVAYVTKCEMNAKQGEVVSYSTSFEGTGALTQSTHA
jgi:predicted secreted protein